MVCAFQGWNDAGDAASSAVSFLASALNARRFARIDSEEFYDFQANRPCIRFDERRHARDRVADGRDLRSAGAASAARSRARAGRRAVDALARVQRAPRRPRRGARRAGGGDAGRAARRRAAHAPGGDDRPRLRRGAGRAPRYASRRATRGRRASSACCTRACADAGLPSASLWASVPHYVAAATNPKAALALLRRVEGLIGVSVDVSELEAAAADYERQVGLAVQSDPDIQAFVERWSRRPRAKSRRSPRTCPRATSSRANSSGFCASAVARGSRHSRDRRSAREGRSCTFKVTAVNDALHEKAGRL